MDSPVTTALRDHVFTITLHHAVMDAALAGALADACAAANEDNDIYAVVLAGSSRVFCTGGAADLYPAAAVAAVSRPVIAAVNGDAYGAGMEIALAADIRLAADTARFALPQVAAGRLPSDGVTQRLPRIVGRGKALELLLTAATVTAPQALEMGLVSQVVPAGELAAAARKLAETVAAKGPLALRALKEAIVKGMDVTLEQGLRLEADLYFLLHTTADRTEGIKAFLAKRQPDYQGK